MPITYTSTKLTAALGALCLLVATTSQVAAQDQFDGEALEEELLSSGTLTVGLTFAYAPYSYLDNGTPAGFDVETLRLIAEALDLEPKFQNTKFSQAILSVKQGNIDLTPGLYMTPERAKSLTLVPYFSAGTAIVVESDSSNPPENKMDLCGLTVSSIKGAAVAEKIRNETNPECTKAGNKVVDVREFATDPAATQALLAGAVDAQLTESIIAATVVKKSNGRLKVSNESPLYPVQVGWGVNKNNPELAKALASALKKIKASGEYEKLRSEYNLKPHDPELAQKAIQ